MARTTTSRRDVLRSMAAGVAGAAIVTPQALAIEPIRRSGGPRLKLSCAAYSFHPYLTGRASPPMTLEDFIRSCAEWDLDGVELTSYYFPTPVSDEYLHRCKRAAFLLGLDVSGTAVSNNFCVPPGLERKKQLDHVRQWIDYAARLGAPTIRIFSGAVPAGASLEEARKWCAECIEEACAYAGNRGIFLALENHGGISTTAEDLLTIVERVQSPWFGVNLDTGNFVSSDPYGDIERVLPYAVNVHLKVEVRPAGRAKEPADLKRLIELIRRSGYRGYVALEYEADQPAHVAVPRYLRALRELIS